MSPTSQHRRAALIRLSLLTALSSALLFSLAAPAAAQSSAHTTSFQLEHFEPLPTQRLNILGTAQSDVLAHMTPSIGLLLHYANDPLVLKQGASSTTVAKLVEHSLKGELWGALGINDWIELGFVLPVALYQSGDALTQLGQPGRSVQGAALSDVRVVPKLRIINPEAMGGFGVALVAPLYIPIGQSSQFLSDESWRAEVRLVADWRHNQWAIATNVGYALRPERAAQSLLLDDQLRYSLGVKTPTGISERLSLIGSIFGSLQTTGERVLGGIPQGENLTSPLEWLAGLRYETAQDLSFQLAAGTGLNQGAGAPDFRVLASLEYTPIAPPDADGDGVIDKDDRCPKTPEDLDGFEDSDGCPDPDDDKDGVLDTNDECPTELEDRDGFEDDDGCPDPDNDKDGINDAEDQCPDQAGVSRRGGCPEDDRDDDGIKDAADQCPDAPEDKDGFQDEDGCPDLDNDADGIEDAQDRCPNDAEDKDSFEDDDGCPDPDNDKDGIKDAEDQCPNEAETYNGNKDEDGCPDGAQTVVITRTSITTTERIYFDTNKSTIQKRSYPLLDVVAQVLIQNPQVTKLRIEGHTDDVGDDKSNDALSKARAKAVLDYLTTQGKISPSRLESEGYGESKPLCVDLPALMKDKTSARKNKTAIEACRATNRRVEFKVLAIDDKPIEATDSITVETKEVVEQPAPTPAP